jgi:O-antigen/teichoic acid export membrane protein
MSKKHDKHSRLSFRANFSWTFFGNAINASCWLAMVIVLAKLGTPEHVGQFALGLAMTAPIFMFATLRLRDIQATDAKNEYLFGDYFAVRIVTTAMAMLAAIGVAFLSGYERETALVIVAHGVSKSVEGISEAFYGFFMKYERLDRVAKSKIMKGPLVLLGLGLGFYLTGSVAWGVIGIAVARAAVLLTYELPNAIASLRHIQQVSDGAEIDNRLRPRWKLTIIKQLLLLALPLGLVQMLISFNVNIPRYFIEGQLGAYQLGLFAAIAAFHKSATTVVQALGHSASPRLARYYAEVNATAFRNLTFKLVGISVLLGCAGIFVALVAGRLILTVMYGPEYALPTLFALVMLASAMDYTASMLLYAITSARCFRIQMPLHILSSVTVAIACWWLIPVAGLNGAAIAVAVGNLIRVVGSAIALLYAQRELGKQSRTPEISSNLHLELQT